MQYHQVHTRSSSYVMINGYRVHDCPTTHVTAASHVFISCCKQPLRPGFKVFQSHAMLLHCIALILFLIGNISNTSQTCSTLELAGGTPHYATVSRKNTACASFIQCIMKFANDGQEGNSFQRELYVGECTCSFMDSCIYYSAKRLLKQVWLSLH